MIVTTVSELPIVGALVRYVEPSTGRQRIGRIERYLTRGQHKGCAVVRAVGIDGRRSTVPARRLHVLLNN